MGPMMTTADHHMEDAADLIRATFLQTRVDAHAR
jgi:hypothetical protein